jgi:hypothetical protein
MATKMFADNYKIDLLRILLLTLPALSFAHAETGLRYFDIEKQSLIDSCAKYEGIEYQVSFNLKNSSRLNLNDAQLIDKNVAIEPFDHNFDLKNCSLISKDENLVLNYKLFALELFDGSANNEAYDVKLFAREDELLDGFAVGYVCNSTLSTADFLRCNQSNIPKIKPENYPIFGKSDKFPEYFEDDYKQIMDILYDMGLGYDDWVYFSYELDGDNREALQKLRNLGFLSKENDFANTIEQVHETRSCLGGFSALGIRNGKREFDYCVQPNPLTDPVIEYDRQEWGEGFFYQVISGWVHEYFHHFQRAHGLDKFVAHSSDCCGLGETVDALPFWIEGSAMVFPDVFLHENFYDLNHTLRNGFQLSETGEYRTENGPVVCQAFDDYLCDKYHAHYQFTKNSHQENGGICYLGTYDSIGLDGVRRERQCDWRLAAYYLAYISSFQIMWVDIPRDMHGLGFPAAFKKHVGMTVDEFAESYSIFMNTGSPADPPPQGFFPEKPLSELVDFWSLKDNPSGQKSN